MIQKPRVMIGVPAYNAEEFIGETISSILSQSYRNFRLLVSIDPSIDKTARICHSFTDPRVSVIENKTRRGWVKNISRLYEQCATEFFNFVGHDDLLSPSYLEAMLRALDSNQQAVCAFSKLQWFGEYKNVEDQKSLTGGTYQRQVTQLKMRTWAGFHGLVRTDALRLAAPLQETDFGSVMEDVLFVSRLALSGETIGLPYTLYAKRKLPDAASSRLKSWSLETKRDAWLNVVTRLLTVAHMAAQSPEERCEMLGLACRSLIKAEEGTWTFFPISDQTDNDKENLVFDFFTSFVVHSRDDLREKYGMDNGNLWKWVKQIALS